MLPQVRELWTRTHANTSFSPYHNEKQQLSTTDSGQPSVLENVVSREVT